MKRVFLFLATNIAIMLVISIIFMFVPVTSFRQGGSLNLPMLLAYSAIIGFVGSFISLLISKWMAKFSTGARVISDPQNDTERWLVSSVKRLADKAGIGMPEVAIYEGEPNAFATGAFKNSALVAVSTGLLESMSKEEVEAVLAHEIGHVMNGDMVTLTLIQGVVNTFVIFFAKIAGYFVDRVILKNESDNRGIGGLVAEIVFQILFGVLASCIVAWFSRQREFRADAAAAQLMGTPQPMINALARLGGVEAGELPKGLAASGISGGKLAAMFASHPPIADRIAALKAR